MFTDYFVERSADLRRALETNLASGGVRGPAREKDVNTFRDFFTFLKEHLPEGFALATGKVRGKKHLLNKACDLLIYDRWCPKFLEMAGGYVLVDSVFSAITLERELSTQAITSHVALTNAVKSLYQISVGADGEQVVPMFSLLVAYGSKVPLVSHKAAIRDAARERDVPVTAEPDMVCVLDQGLIVKDWENAGEYKVVETGPDTLMWFYILLLEYLDRDGTMKYQLRDYIKTSKTYKEY